MSAALQNWQTWVNFERSYNPSRVCGGAASWMILRRISTGVLRMKFSALLGWVDAVSGYGTRLAYGLTRLTGTYAPTAIANDW